MLPTPPLLDRIESDLGQFRKAEAKVARVVLADPPRIIRSSLATIASMAEVSEPTVIRFCRSLGFEGFPDFKIGLAQDLATGVPYVSPHIAVGDDAETYTAKIISSTVAAIQNTAAGLDARRVEAAVRTLSGAERIVIFGVGGSSAVALDAYHKLVRLHFNCQHSADAVIARMLIPAMMPGDALIALSYTGRTMSVLELARIAQARGVRVIGITTENSRLDRMSDVALTVPPGEDGDVFTPMAARIAMLAIIDVLATGVALARGAASLERLAAIKDVLKETRYSVDDLTGER